MKIILYTSSIWLFGVYVCVREFVFFTLNLWLNTTNAFYSSWKHPTTHLLAQRSFNFILSRKLEHHIRILHFIIIFIHGRLLIFFFLLLCFYTLYIHKLNCWYECMYVCYVGIWIGYNVRRWNIFRLYIPTPYRRYNAMLSVCSMWIFDINLVWQGLIEQKKNEGPILIFIPTFTFNISSIILDYKIKICLRF